MNEHTIKAILLALLRDPEVAEAFYGLRNWKPEPKKAEPVSVAVRFLDGETRSNRLAELPQYGGPSRSERFARQDEHDDDEDGDA